MFSKICCLIIFISLMVSCSLDTDDYKSKDIIKAKINAVSLKCIDEDVLPFFNDMAASSASSSESAFSCLSYAFIVLDEFVNVKSGKPITIDEFKMLVKKNKIKYNEKTERIINLLFDVKHNLIKGDSKSVTGEEIKKFKSIFNAFKSFFNKADPYLQLVNLDPQVQPSSDQVNLALQSMEDSGSILLDILKKNKLEITKIKLESWLRSTGYLPSKSEDSSYDRLSNEEYVAQVKFEKKWNLYWSAHQILWNKHRGKLSYLNADEWLKGVKVFLSTSLKFSSKWSFAGYISGKDTKDILDHLCDSVELIKKTIFNRKNKMIKYEEIFDLLEKFDNVYGFGRGLELDTLKNIIPIVVEKMIGIPKKIRANNHMYRENVFSYPFEKYYSGFTSYHLNNLFLEFERYKSIQFSIMNNNINSGVFHSGDFSKDKRDFTNVIESIRSYFPEAGEIPTLVKDQEFGVYLELGVDNKFNQRNLTMFNLFNLFARAVSRGYSLDESFNVSYSSISVEQITHFIADFEKFFEQIYLLEKRNSADLVAWRIYLESKLFISSGDGVKTNVVEGESVNSRVSNIQAMETMAFYTSGVFTYNKVYQELSDLCTLEATGLVEDDVSLLIKTQPTVFAQKPLLKSCFKKHYLQTLVKHISNLPNMQNYIREYLVKLRYAQKDFKYDFYDSFEGDYSSGDWEELFFKEFGNEFSLLESLIYAGQSTGFISDAGEVKFAPFNESLQNLSIDENPYITRADFAIMGTILYFVESAMLKFDTDNNNKIDKDEVDLSYSYLNNLDFLSNTNKSEENGEEQNHDMNLSFSYLKDLIILKSIETCSEATFRNILLMYSGDSDSSPDLSRFIKECTGTVLNSTPDKIKQLVKDAHRKIIETKQSLAHDNGCSAELMLMSSMVKQDSFLDGLKFKKDILSNCLKGAGKSSLSNLKKLIPFSGSKTENHKIELSEIDKLKRSLRNKEVNAARDEVISKAIAKESRLNEENEIAVDRGDLLDVISFIKTNSVKDPNLKIK